MSIPLFGTPVSLFNRLGKLGALVANVRAYQLTQETALINTSTGVVAGLNSESDIQALIGSSYMGLLQGPEGASNTAVNVAQAVANRMVYRDLPQQNQTLTGTNIFASLIYIIQQMEAQGATILAMTVGASSTAFTGTGNGVIVFSNKRPFDGLVLENSYAETLTLTCTQDSYTGGATAGNETISVTGAGSQGDVFAFNWPLGSNCSVQLSSIDGNASSASGNLLNNSGFDAWTANVPDNWVLVVGVAGTNVAEEMGIVYSSTASLALIGAGSALTQLTQAFNDSTGTTTTLTPQTQYAVNLFIRRDGVAPGAGILVFDLVDENDVTLLDNNNVPNSFSINLTTLTTSFANYSGVFRTPTIMPSATRFRMRLTTALTNGRTVYIDKLSFGLMTQLYTSGPFLSVHSGSVDYIQGAYATCSITNSRGAGGTLSTWQTLLGQLFPPVLANEFLFPSSATPSISDSLIA